MNIAFVTDDNVLQSVVYDIHLLAEGLSRLGHQVFVVSSQRGEDARFKTAEDVLNRVYPDSTVRLIRTGEVKLPKVKTLLGSWRTRHVLDRLLRTHKIDVIMLYSVVRSGFPAIRLAEKYGIPVVFRNIDMLHRLMPNWMERSVVRSCEQYVYAHADKLLALSPRYADYLKSLGASCADIEVLPFSIDTNMFRPDLNTEVLRRQWHLDGSKKIIVYLGCLYRFSGLLDFVQSVPDLIHEIPNARVLIVGDGPLRTDLEALISKLKLQDCVTITGIQPFHDIPYYINLADVCINTYPVSGLMKDLFCAKVVQYLACAKPVVSTALPGMTSVLHGESCGVVYADDIAGLSREAVKLLQSAERCRTVGTAGRAYVQEAHNVGRQLGQLEHVLQAVVQKKTMKIDEAQKENGGVLHGAYFSNRR